YLKEFKPDVVLCTHYLPLEILGRLRVSSDRELGASHRASKSQIRIKERGPPAPLVVSIVTDFEAHALWMDGGVDLYCVADEATKARLVARGAPEENVVATGIPISAKFSSKPDSK